MISERLSVLLTCFILVSCSPEKEMYFEITKNAKVFKVDSRSNNYSSFIKVLDIVDSVKYTSIVIGQPSKNAFDFYSLDDGTLQKSLEFDYMGPNGSKGSGVGGIISLNNENLLINSRGASELMEVNMEGKVLRRYKLADFQSIVKVYSDNGTLNKDNLVYFTGSFKGYVFTELKGKPWKYRLNLETEDLKSLIRYPEEFSGIFLGPQIVPSDAFFEDHIIVVYPISSDIYIYDLDGNEIERINVQSEWVNQKTPPMSVPSFDLYDQHILLNPLYSAIIFDNYRDLFYRIILLPFEKEDLQNNQFHPFRNRPGFVLQVISRDFQLLHEQIMRDCQHEANDHFVSRDGLYISENHLKNMDQDESLFRFSKFTFQDF